MFSVVLNPVIPRTFDKPGHKWDGITLEVMCIMGDYELEALVLRPDTGKFDTMVVSARHVGWSREEVMEMYHGQ